MCRVWCAEGDREADEQEKGWIWAVLSYGLDVFEHPWKPLMLYNWGDTGSDLCFPADTLAAL